MRREKHGLPLRSPPRLLKGEGAELRDLAVDHRGELVDDDALRSIGDDPREGRAKLLAVRQHSVGPQPGWHVAQAYRGQRRGDIVKVLSRPNRVDDRGVVRPLGLVVHLGAGKHERAERRLTRAGGPDNDANPPVPILDRQFGVKREVGAGLRVEERLHAGGAVGVVVRAAVANLSKHQTTTSRHS